MKQNYGERHRFSVMVLKIMMVIAHSIVLVMTKTLLFTMMTVKVKMTQRERRKRSLKDKGEKFSTKTPRLSICYFNIANEYSSVDEFRHGLRDYIGI